LKRALVAAILLFASSAWGQGIPLPVPNPNSINNPSASGSGSVTANSPLTGSGTVGSPLACPTCATTTNGGALSGTAPIAISAGGAISESAAAIYPSGSPAQITGYSASNTPEAETVSGAGDCGTMTFSRTGANAYLLTSTCLKSNGNLFTSNTFGAALGLSTNTTISASNITAGLLAIAQGGTNSATAATAAGTGIAVSGTFPNQTVSSKAEGDYFATIATGSIQNDFYGFALFANASTIDNITLSAAVVTCTTAPVIEIDECGTSTTCASQTILGTGTLSSADTAIPITVTNSGAIGAAHYLAVRITNAFACAGLITTSLHIMFHSN
jgi:hypothetical protein